MNELSIIIINWNGIRFLPDCLKSIADNPPNVPYEVVVVDNASTDESVEWLKSDEPHDLFGKTPFTLIESADNLGFGLGNNLAIDKCSSPSLLLLNPDTLIHPRAIDNLLEALTLEEQIGIVGPRLLNADGSLQPSVWAHPPTATKFFVEAMRLHVLLPKGLKGKWLAARHWPHDERRFVTVLSGAAMMVNRKMIDRIGAFDPKFHMYGEDGEWCLRANKAGWKVLFDPSAEIIHLGGQSAVQRWGDGVRLKEEQAFLDFILTSLSPSQVMRIAIARWVIAAAMSIKNRILNNSNSRVLNEFMRIQFRGFLTAFDRWIGR